MEKNQQLHSECVSAGTTACFRAEDIQRMIVGKRVGGGSGVVMCRPFNLLQFPYILLFLTFTRAAPRAASYMAAFIINSKLLWPIKAPSLGNIQSLAGRRTLNNRPLLPSLPPRSFPSVSSRLHIILSFSFLC